MHIVHPSSSSRKAALLVMISLLGMAGCSGGPKLFDETQALLEGLRPTNTTSNNDVRIIHAPSSALPLKPVISPAADMISNAAVLEPELPSWCKYLKEDAAAQGVILRSPVLSGSYDSDGKSSVDLGLSYSAFKKADLLDEAAQVKCRQYVAQTSLQKIIFVSPTNLTAAGFKAKANAIAADATKISKLRSALNSALQKGEINRERATAITVLLDQYLAEGANARSQADRRQNEHDMSPKKADVLSQDLLRAESDLANVNSQIRTFENMDVAVQAGYGNTGALTPGGTTSEGFSGKVSFSLKLGTLEERRFDHERAATQAKLQAMQGEDGGLIWQIGVLKRAHENAISGLVESQAKLDQAIRESNHLLSVLSSVPNPEFEGSRLTARYDIMKMKAERAGVIGSIAEIRANLGRLKS